MPKPKYVLPGRGIDDACSVGDMALVRKLMGNKDGGGVGTGLLTAATYGRVEVLDMLLDEYKVDVDMQAEGGYTALMCAAKNGKHAVIDSLIAHNANPRLYDHTFMTAEDHALMMGHNYIVNALRSASKGTDPPTPEEALDDMNLHYLKRCHAEGRWTPNLKSFLSVCKKKFVPPNPDRFAIVQWMISVEPSLASAAVPNGDTPPIMAAANAGDIPLIQLLLNHGASAVPSPAGDPAATAAQNGFTHAGDILALEAAEKNLQLVLSQKRDVPADPDERADWVAKLRAAKQNVSKCKKALEKAEAEAGQVNPEP